MPHVAGTESDRIQAKWTRDKFTEFGIPNAEIKTYYPLLNYPISHRLAIVSGPEYLRYNATLKEDRVDEDPSTEDPDIVPLFHGKQVVFYLCRNFLIILFLQAIPKTELQKVP